MEAVTETHHLLCETDQNSQINQELMAPGFLNENRNKLKQNKELQMDCDLQDAQDHSIIQENNKIKEKFQEKDDVIQCMLKEMEDTERCSEERLTAVMRELETKSVEQKEIQKDYVKLWLKYEEASSYLADAKCQEKKALEVSVELRYKNSILTEQRDTLHGSVKYLRKLLYNQHNMPNKKTKSTLRNENNELRNQVGVLQNKVKKLELQTETRKLGDVELMEQRQKDYYTLWVKYKETVSGLADAEDRERKALEDNAVLRHSNFVLMDQREVLQDSLNHLRELFSQERKMHIKSVKSTLQNKNNALRKQVIILQTKVNMFEEQLKIRRRRKEEQMEQEQSQKDYNTLWVKYEETVSNLADAENREMRALEANATMEHNNSILMEHQEALQSSLDHLQELFALQRKTHAKLMKSTLQNANKTLRKHVRFLHTKVNMLEEQLKKGGTHEEEPMEQSQKDYYTLWVKYEEAVSYLADAEDGERKTLEVNADLENDNSILLEQREALKDSSNQMTILFCQLRKTGVKLIKSTLQNENNALRKHVKILQTKIEKLEEQLEIRTRSKAELTYWLENFQDFMAKQTALKSLTFKRPDGETRL